MSEPTHFQVRSPEELRAVAHPVRQRILFDLLGHGHGRAADLATRLGEPANAISFHLRVLAKAGMIVEAPEHARDRRDRVWAPAADDYQVDPAVAGVDGILGGVVDVVRENLRLAVEHGGRQLPEDQPKRALTVSTTVFTREQAAALADEVNAVIERWTTASLASLREHPDEATRGLYRVVFAIGPDGSANPSAAETEDPAEVPATDVSRS